MISIRAGRGIGDALYLQSIVRHFVEQGQRIEACSDWPDVFRPLDGKVKVSPFRRDRISKVAHYTSRKTVTATDQFQDCCINAGIRGPVDLRMDWMPVNVDLIERIRRDGRPRVIVQMPREPFGRSDGYGLELLPDCSALQRALDEIRGRALLIQVGSGTSLHRLRGIDLDLSNETSVSDLLDVAWAASGFIGYCSFMVPLAESFSKPALFLWSRRGLNSRNDYLRTITPRKILHRASSHHIIDDCSDREMTEAVDALCQQIRCEAEV